MDDTVVQPPTPPETVQIPPSPPPRKNYSVVLIVILVILIGILVGMELDETTIISNFRSLYARPTPIPTSLPTPSPTPDPTADWETYTSPSMDFSFKYPPEPEFVTDCCNISLFELTPLVGIAQKNTVLPNTDASFNGFAVGIDPNPSHLSFDQYVTQTKSKHLQIMKNGPGGISTTQSEQPVYVGGQKGIQLFGYTSFINISYIYAPFPTGTKILVIAKNEQQKGNFLLFDQILSTFKFTQ